MNNLFDFEYQTSTINNQDGTPSRFGVVFGEAGKVIHTKKDSYNIVKTESLSSLGQTFLDRGYNVSTFSHKAGEVIGLNITFGERQTKIGDKAYNAIITVPNNGGGKGYLSVQETRMICTNGMVHKIGGARGMIKIPHTFNYEKAIELMEQSLIEFTEIMKISEERDEALNDQGLTKPAAMKMLNQWFYEQEMPEGHRKQMTFDQFRKALATEPGSITSIERYEQLKEAFDKEVAYNKELNLKLSKYTVYASVTNYLSRRVELSQSVAPVEIKKERAAAKVANFAF